MKKLNHIGIAVNNLEKNKEKYIKEGYIVLNEVYDEIFLVNLCLMKKHNEQIELVYTQNEKSSVYNMCKNNDEKVYHKCYEVENIEESIYKLKNNGYIMTSEIVPSKLLNGQVCFLYSKEEGLIELLEVYDGKYLCV